MLDNKIIQVIKQTSTTVEVARKNKTKTTTKQQQQQNKKTKKQTETRNNETKVDKYKQNLIISLRPPSCATTPSIESYGTPYPTGS